MTAVAGAAIWLVTEKQDHPVLNQVVDLLRRDHLVAVVDPTDAPPAGHCDLLLLKSHSAAALRLARAQSALGVDVVNAPDAVEATTDRVAMASRALASGVPFPSTTLTTVDELASGGAAPFVPCVVKSRFSRGGDFVARVTDVRQLDGQTSTWGREPVVVQPLLPNDGVDHKVWVVGDAVFHQRRQSPLNPPDEPRGVATPVPTASRPEPSRWMPLIERLRSAFGLELFGFDVIDTPTGPVVVDVNSFPGVRGMAGAAEAFCAFAVRRLATNAAERDG
jgi:ribosomal protein S6--L-glutamate ligase